MTHFDVIDKLLYLCKWENDDEQVLQWIFRQQISMQWALRGAAFGGKMQLFQLLQKQSSATDFDWPMFYAAWGGQIHMIEFLFNNGGGGVVNSGLSGAGTGGHLDLIHWFLTRGANNLNQAFVNACQCGHLAVVQCLISRGADQFNLGLSYASGNGHVDVVEFLLSLKRATNLNEVCDDVSIKANYFDKKNGRITSSLACNPDYFYILLLLVRENGASNLNSLVLTREQIIYLLNHGIPREKFRNYSSLLHIDMHYCFRIAIISECLESAVTSDVVEFVMFPYVCYE